MGSEEGVKSIDVERQMNVAAVQMVIHFFHHFSNTKTIHVIHLQETDKFYRDCNLIDPERLRGYHGPFYQRHFFGGTYCVGFDSKLLY